MKKLFVVVVSLAFILSGCSKNDVAIVKKEASISGCSYLIQFNYNDKEPVHCLYFIIKYKYNFKAGYTKSGGDYDNLTTYYVNGVKQDFDTVNYIMPSSTILMELYVDNTPKYPDYDNLESIAFKIYIIDKKGELIKALVDKKLNA